MDDSVEQQIAEFLKYCSDRGIELPDPEHYPIQFAYHVKLWKYYSSQPVQHSGSAIAL